MDEVVRRCRSSFETIMHLNVVEDVARLDDEGCIADEDMAALNKTISSLNAKSYKSE